MASKIGLSYRREAVLDRFRHEANRLRARGVDIGSFPEGGRDPDVKALDQLAYAADLLAAANDRFDELRDGSTDGDASYDTMKVGDLKQLMDDRGLAYPSGAKKGDLVALLVADDEAPEHESADDTSGETDASDEGSEDEVSP